LCFVLLVIPSGSARGHPTLVEISEEFQMRVLPYKLIPLDWPTILRAQQLSRVSRLRQNVLDPPTTPTIVTKSHMTTTFTYLPQAWLIA
jgi:hypothetical protein